MGRLTAHHLASHHALGILHWDAAFTTLHEHDECNHSDHEDEQPHHQREGHRSPSRVLRLVDQVHDPTREADHDAGKDQQRHAIAHTALGDLLTKPHPEDRTTTRL